MAYGLSEVLKLAERQARPCQALSSVESLVTCPPAGDWSLPSNHATIAAALAAIVIVNRSRLAPLAVLLAVGVAVSRVALGVHYPHDVTTGLLLGTLVVVALTAALVPRTSRMLEAAAGHRLLGHRSD